MKKGAAFLRKGNGVLVISLIILILVVIGLVVWVLVDKINHETTDDGQEPNDSYVIVDDKYNILNGIRGYINTVEATEAEEYLDEKIEEYKNSNIDVDVRLIKASYLRDINKFEEALTILDSLLEKDLDQRDKISVLSIYSNVCKKMGDEEKAQEYFNKYMEEYLDYYDGGAGGA